MKSRTIITQICISILLFSGICSAQELHIGSPTPDLFSNSVINHTSSELRLSDIKKKWVLLDFWSTGCASCVASFGKMDKLQEQFDKDLQIILINHEKETATVDFFKKKARLKKARVPYITEDSLFRFAFPHSFFPYYVLLDSNRNVVAFPDYEYVSNGPMEDLVKNNKVNFGHITTPIRMKDGESILGALDSANFFKAQSYFILVKGVDGLTAHGYNDPTIEGVFNRFTLAGVSFKALFTIVMSELKSQRFTREAVMIEAKDKDSLAGPADPIQYREWLKTNCYAIDILVSEQNVSQIMSLLLENLTKHFKVSVGVEKREVPCFVLKRLNAAKELTTAGGKPSAGSRKIRDGYLWTMTNKRFTAFSDLLKDYFDSLINTKPFVDATGITGNVDMAIDMAFFEKYQQQDISIVNSEIRKYGLVVVEEDYLTDVVVIRDQK